MLTGETFKVTSVHGARQRKWGRSWARGRWRWAGWAHGTRGRKGLEYGEWLHQSIRVAALWWFTVHALAASCGRALAAHCWPGQELKNGYGHRFQASSTFAEPPRRKQRSARAGLVIRARPPARSPAAHREREQDAAPPRYYCTYYALAHKTNGPGAGGPREQSRALRINPLFIHGAAQQIIRFLYFRAGRARWLRRQRACKSRIIGWKYCRRFKEVAAARAFEALFPRRCSFSSPFFLFRNE